MINCVKGHKEIKVRRKKYPLPLEMKTVVNFAKRNFYGEEMR